MEKELTWILSILLLDCLGATCWEFFLLQLVVGEKVNRIKRLSDKLLPFFVNIFFPIYMPIGTVMLPWRLLYRQKGI